MLRLGGKAAIVAACALIGSLVLAGVAYAGTPTPVVQPPKAPSNFGEAGPTTHLEWDDNSDNEDGFRLMLQVGDNDPRIEATYPPNTTTAPFLAGTFEEMCQMPFLWVVAFNAAGESARSNVDHVSPPPSGCPFTDMLTFTNDSGTPANKLVLPYPYGWQTVAIAQNPPACDQPTIVLSTYPDPYEFAITWPTNCVQPGASVQLSVSGVGPTVEVTGLWSAMATPTPSPSPPPVSRATPSPTVTPAALPQAGDDPGSDPGSGAILAAGVILILGGSLALKRIR